MLLDVRLDGSAIAAAPIPVSAGALSAQASKLLGPSACIAGKDCWLVLLAR